MDKFDEEYAQLETEGLELELERLETDNWRHLEIDEEAHEKFSDLMNQGTSPEEAMREAEFLRFRLEYEWAEEIGFPGDIEGFDWRWYGDIPDRVYERYGVTRESKDSPLPPPTDASMC